VSARRGPRARGRLAVALSLLCAAAAPGPTAVAQPPAVPAPGPGVTRRPNGVEFDFQNTDLRVVLSALADAAGLNAVLSDVPTRTVTLRTARPATPAEVRAYLESVVRSNNLSMEEEGGLLRIAGGAGGDAASVAAAQRRSRDPVRLFVLRLRHTEAATLAQTVSSLFDLSGGGAGAGPPMRDASLSHQLEGVPPPAFPPRPIDPSGPLNDQFTGRTPRAQQPGDPGESGQAAAQGLTGPVRIVPDARTNALLIRSNGADYSTIRAAVEQIDVRPVQVLIEVLIAEIRRDRQAGLGVSARMTDQRVNDGGTRVGGELTGASTGDLVIRALQVGGVRADVVLRTLAANSEVSILSRPLVVARNNQEARILVGSERPFVQLFRSLPTDAAVRDQVVQYRNVGTQLTIRPTINPDGYVSLAVLQEVSSATAETQFGAPVISTREARTELLVKDGRTVVLGGLVDQQREQGASGIPVLKDLPLLGWLFRSTQQRRSTTELFLFLTPHVIRTDEEYEDMTRRLRDRTDEVRRAPGSAMPGAPRDSVRP
jgi:general secretion pathway protein D